MEENSYLLQQNYRMLLIITKAFINNIDKTSPETPLNEIKNKLYNWSIKIKQLDPEFEETNKQIEKHVLEIVKQTNENNYSKAKQIFITLKEKVDSMLQLIKNHK